MKAGNVKVNYLFSLFASIVALIVPFLTAPYLSRVFNASILGTNSYISTVSNGFVIIATFGFYIFGQREIARCSEDKAAVSRVFWNVFLSRLLLVLVCCLIYTGIYFASDRNLLYIIYVFSIIHVAFDCGFLFAGLQKFGMISVVSAATKLLACVAIFVFVRGIDDIWIYAVISVSSVFAPCLIIFFACLSKVQTIPLSEINIPQVFRKSFKLFLPTIAISIFTLFDKLMIQWMVPGVTTMVVDGIEKTVTCASAESGFYVQADSVIAICLTVIYALQSVMISKNAEQLEKGNNEVVLQNLYRANQFIAFLTVPMTVGLIAVAKCFCDIYYGSGYEKCAILLMIAAPTFLFSGLHGMVGNHYLIAKGQENKYTFALFFGGGINILVNIALIPFFGSVGAMISTAIGKLSISIVTVLLTRKDLRYKSYFFNYLKCSIPGFVMAGLVLAEWFLVFKQNPSIMALIVMVASGAFIYLCGVTMIKGNLIKEGWDLVHKRIQAHLKPDEE